MAWSIVGVSSSVEVTGTSHALVTTGISGLAAGDLLVACIASRIASTTPITLPTGGEWTLVSQQNANNILTNQNATASGLMAYCVRGASNPNLTFTHPTAPSVAIGRIVAYRGSAPSSPLDTQTSFTTATNTTAVSGAGLTSNQSNDLLVAMAAGGQEAAWSAFAAVTAPTTASGATDATTAPSTTWRERADALTTTGTDTSLAVFDAIKTTAAATGNFTATASVAAAHVVIVGAFKDTNKRIGADPGSYTLTGAATTNTLLRRKAVADVGSYALTGTAATLTLGAAGGGGGPVAVSYISENGGGTSGDAFFTSTVDIGAADSSKVIVVACSLYTGATTTITSATLDGVSGTVYESAAYGGERALAFVVFPMPTQSGSVSFTITGTASLWNYTFHWYKLLNAEAVPVDTAAAAHTGDDATANVTAVADGAVLGLYVGFNTSNVGAFLGTGWTTQLRSVSSYVTRSGYNAAAAGSFDVTADYTGGGGQGVAALAFEPLPGGPVGYTLPAAAGVYALTGQPAALTKSGAKVLQASAGAYALTGTAANLTASTGYVFVYVGHSLVDAIKDGTDDILPGDQYYQTIVGSPLSYNWEHAAEAAFDAKAYCAANTVSDLVLCENNTIAPHVTKPWIEVWRNNALTVSPNVRTWWYQCWQTIGSGGADIAAWKTSMAAYIAAHEVQIQQLYLSVGTNHPKMIPGGLAMVALYDAVEALEISGLTDPEAILPDGVHPDDPGQYFMCMVHYAALTGTTPVGLSNTITGITGISTAMAADLQALAWDIVSTYPFAGIAAWPEPPSSEGEITLGTMGTDVVNNWPGPPNYNDCPVDFGTARAGRTLVMFFGGSNDGQLGDTCIIDPAGDAISVPLIDSTDASPTSFAATLFYGAVPSDVAGTVTVRVDTTAGAHIIGRFYWMVVDGAVDTPKEVLLAKGDFTDQINGDACFFFASGGYDGTTGATAPDAAWDTYGAWDTKVWRVYGGDGAGWDAVHTIDGNDPWGLSAAASGFKIMQLLLEPAVPPATLAAEAGFYLFSGTAATLTKLGNKIIVAGAGSYALTGTAATPRRNLPLIAGAGSYALAGADAAPELGKKIAADAGSYVLTGTDATLSYSGTGTGASIAYVTGTANSTDASSYTFTAHAIGTASATRKTVVVVSGRDTGTTATITGVTLGGDAMTQVINQTVSATNISLEAIFELDTGTGTTLDGLTTGTIIVNFSETVLRCRVSVYTLTDTSSVYDTNFNADTASATLSSLTLDIPEGGVALAGLYSASSSGTVSWTGLTEDVDVTLETNKISTASDAFSTGETGRTIEATCSVAGVDRILVAASWGLASTITADAGSYALTGSDATLVSSAALETRQYMVGAPYPVFVNEGGSARQYSVFGAYVNETPVGEAAAGFEITADAGSYALTGQPATLRRSLRADALPGSYSVSGQPAGTLHRWKLDASVAGSYAVTGQPATFRHTWRVIADTVGSYVVTGFPATPNKVAGKFVTADPGAYSISGQLAATLHRWKVIATTVGAYTVTGQLAATRHGWKVIATTVGAYTITGQPATFRHTWRNIATTVGAYTFTGQPATFRHTWRNIATTVGAYTVTGFDAAAIKSGGNRIIPADAGSYIISGQVAATLHRWKVIATTVGAYSLTGVAATLRRALPIIAGVGGYSIAGQVATPKLGRKVSATTVGAYTVTGFDATAIQSGGNRITVADAGAYALTGVAASTLQRRKVVATTVGAYTISGSTAATLRGRKVVATTVGSYALTGVAATFRSTRRIIATVGAYTITGQPAALLRIGVYALIAETGAYASSGTTALTLRGRKTIAATGAYALSGNPVTMRRTWKIVATASAYTLTGTPALPRRALTPAPPDRSEDILASRRYHRLETANRYAIVPAGQRRAIA